MRLGRHNFALKPESKVILTYYTEYLACGVPDLSKHLRLPPSKYE